MTETTKKEYEIAAAGKKLGRVATEAANILMGKNDPSFRKHTAPDVTVTITNARMLDISSNKAAGKVYTRYTQYPGGLRKETLSEVLEKKGASEAMRRAVKGMLPKNKLQAVMLKNLVVTE